MNSGEELEKNIETGSNLSLLLGNKSLRSDRIFMRKVVKEEPQLFRYSSDELRNDLRFVEGIIEEIDETEKILEFSSQVVKGDKNIVLKATKKSFQAFQHASFYLRNSKSFFLDILRITSKRVVEFMGSELESESRILEILKLRGCDMKDFFDNVRESFGNHEMSQKDDLLFKVLMFDIYFSETIDLLRLFDLHFSNFPFFIRNDKKLVLDIIAQDVEILYGVSEELSDDIEVVKKSIDQYYCDGHWRKTKYSNSLYECLGPKLKESEELACIIVRNNHYELDSMSENLRESRRVILSSLEDGVNSLWRNYPERLRDDKEFMKVCLERRGGCLEYCSDRLKDDPEMVLLGLKMDNCMRGNERSGGIFRFASERLSDKKDFVIQAVKCVGNAFEYASERLRNDLDVFIETTKTSPSAFQYVGEELIQKTGSQLLPVLKKNGNISGLKSFSRSLMTLGVSREEILENLEILKSEEGTWEKLSFNTLSHRYFQYGGGSVQFGVSYTNHIGRFLEKREDKIEVSNLKMVMERKELRFKDFIFHQKLGEGVFGATYLCSVKFLFGLFVVKLYLRLEQTPHIVNLSVDRDSLDIPYHPNVATILWRSVDEVMDYTTLPNYEEDWKDEIEFGENLKQVRGGYVLLMHYNRDLKGFLDHRESRNDNLGTYEICSIIIGVLEGVQHLYSHMIVHRDLHPGNIFIEPGSEDVHIGDFGCSLDLRRNKTGFLVRKNDELMFGVCSYTYFERGGYRKFLPPEVSEFDYEKGEIVDYSSCDIFSVGVLGSRMLDLVVESEKNFDERAFKEREKIRKVVLTMRSHEKNKRISAKEAVNRMKEVLSNLHYVEFHKKKQRRNFWRTNIFFVLNFVTLLLAFLLVLLLLTLVSGASVVDNLLYLLLHFIFHAGVLISIGQVTDLPAVIIVGDDVVKRILGLVSS